MASSTLTIRVDSELKEEAARIVEHYGLDLSTVIRALFKQIVNTKAIPLSFAYNQTEAASSGGETAAQAAVPVAQDAELAKPAVKAEPIDAPAAESAAPAQSAESPAAAAIKPEPAPEPEAVSETVTEPEKKPASQADRTQMHPNTTQSPTTRHPYAAPKTTSLRGFYGRDFNR